MMRQILTIALLTMSLSLYGQRDKVYLKNGSLLKGNLLQIDARSLTMDLGEAAPVNISLTNLKAIRLKRKKTTLSKQEIQRTDSVNKLGALGGFHHQIRLGMLTGEDGTTYSTFSNLSFDYTLLYPLNAGWTLGAGVGLDQYPSFQTIPFAVEFRKNWGFSLSPFFIFARLGYALAEARGDFFGPVAQVNGRELLVLGLGQQWSLGKSAILISAGYRTQSLQTSWQAGDFNSRTDWNLNRLDFKIGVIF